MDTTRVLKIADVEIPVCDPLSITNPLDCIYGIVYGEEKGKIEVLPFPTDAVVASKNLSIAQTKEVLQSKDIIEAVGGLDIALVTFAEIWWLLRLQRHGESGLLPIGSKQPGNGYTLAFIKGKDGNIRAFYFLWCDCCGGWNIYESPFDEHPQWAKFSEKDPTIDGWFEGLTVITQKQE